MTTKQSKPTQSKLINLFLKQRQTQKNVMDSNADTCANYLLFSAYLWNSDSTFSCQLFLGFFTWVRIWEVRVEILIKNFTWLFTKVTALPTRVQEAGSENHDSLAGGLLQLDLDWVELLMNDVDHPVYLLGSDGSGSGLFSEEVHHVGGKLLATLNKGIDR